ncbi:hypothetical protein PVK06_009054 [Gossypium arboreum]|uniref:Reverse transcriptase domain-containing protein n=1 Tax=Gossypium arboreum TaxID=29729 RepID=A0ABR0QLW7_GOSAR|nr:hypothetical protein PVK06_009054 [Gossypium arboreum]
MEWEILESLSKREIDIKGKLEEVLNHEELLWKQKSKCDWLKLRDKNTKFFHSQTMHRKKVNRIVHYAMKMVNDYMTQMKFNPKQNIFDNIIITQEVIHSMRGNSKMWITVKINLEQVYDKVQWEFIDRSIQAAEIPDFLRKVIVSSISTIQILWNGIPIE